MYCLYLDKILGYINRFVGIFIFLVLTYDQPSAEFRIKTIKFAVNILRKYFKYITLRSKGWNK